MDIEHSMFMNAVMKRNYSDAHALRSGGWGASRGSCQVLVISQPQADCKFLV